MWLGAGPPPTGLGSYDRFGPVIAFPGLVNSHDHLGFNCYPPTGAPPYRDFLGWSRDVQADRSGVTTVEAIPPALRRQAGLLKNLLWGVTAVADHGGLPDGEGPVRVLAPYKDLHSPELGKPWSWLAGTRPVVMHLAEGVTRESRRRALDYLGWNLWRRPVAGVHGVSLEDGDFDRLAALVWCPASNLFLFGRTAKAAAAARRTTLLFGSDATISAPGTLWDHLRYARGAVREEIILAALTEAADRFWRLERPGDFVVARRRFASRWDAFFAVTPADILAVVRENKTMLLDRDLAPSCPPGFAPLGRKYVRMDLAPLLDQLSAHTDPAKLVARFTGASTSDTRAE
jgi:hypothetical protein